MRLSEFGRFWAGLVGSLDSSGALGDLFWWFDGVGVNHNSVCHTNVSSKTVCCTDICHTIVCSTSFSPTNVCIISVSTFVFTAQVGLPHNNLPYK